MADKQRKTADKQRKTAAEIKKRLVEMDSEAETFNRHLLALPAVITPYVSDEIRDRVAETLMLAGIALRADRHVILTTLLDVGILDTFHDQLVAHDAKFFEAYDYDEQLRAVETTGMASHDRSYYNEIIGAIKNVWPDVSEDVRAIIWNHVDKFYGAYLAYATDFE
jgi:hypothetical protein